MVVPIQEKKKTLRHTFVTFGVILAGARLAERL
jgi:hypothetical protein